LRIVLHPPIAYISDSQLKFFSTDASVESIRACHCCGLIHRLPALQADERSICVRCESILDTPQSLDVAQGRTAAAAVAALLLFPAATMLPILEIEKLGHHHRSSILGGIVELYRSGSFFIASVILVFSIVLPLAKILALIELSWVCSLRQRHRAWTYRLVEHIGKWSMMDVMLLSFLVMLIKLSGLVAFHFGPAVIAFVLCVVMSILASVCFNPHAIWESP
jgi:paraquat-inducible protein A